MFEYQKDDIVGQNCNNYKGSQANTSYSISNEGISCNSCDNYNGRKCIRDSYNTVTTKLQID